MASLLSLKHPSVSAKIRLYVIQTLQERRNAGTLKWNAGQEGCRKGGTLERRNARQEGMQ